MFFSGYLSVFLSGNNSFPEVVGAGYTHGFVHIAAKAAGERSAGKNLPRAKRRQKRREKSTFFVIALNLLYNKNSIFVHFSFDISCGYGIMDNIGLQSRFVALCSASDAFEGSFSPKHAFENERFHTFGG